MGSLACRVSELCHELAPDPLSEASTLPGHRLLGAARSGQHLDPKPNLELPEHWLQHRKASLKRSSAHFREQACSSARRAALRLSRASCSSLGYDNKIIITYTILGFLFSLPYNGPQNPPYIDPLGGLTWTG